jgi:hypothetical protein
MKSMLDLCIRYGAFALVLACTLVVAVVGALDADWALWLLILVPLSLLGIWDVLQPHHTLLYRGGWCRRRHRRGAGRVFRSYGHGAARWPDPDAQCAGGHGPAQYDPHRRQRQGLQRLFDRPQSGAGRRLVQCGPGFHVYPGLRHVQKVPHRTGPNAVATMDRIVEFLPYRALLDDPDSTPYAEWWAAASPDSFQPLQHTGPG